MDSPNEVPAPMPKPVADPPAVQPVVPADFVGPTVTFESFFAWISQRLYTSNPFYVISAALVLAGLNLMFGGVAQTSAVWTVDFNAWALLTTLVGYVLLLSATAWAIVRYGKVWDDARTILLVLIVLFVAISVNFDKLTLLRSTSFAAILVTGLLGSIAISEFLLRGLRIRLPLLYRFPYYLFLTLFFLWPVLLVYLLDTVGDVDNRRGFESTLWGIFAFPSIAAVLNLLLIPAVRKGEAYVQPSGTPWPWPLFPWSLFFFLNVGVLFRSYYLSLSFHPGAGMETAFDWYFLIPLVLSIAWLLLEWHLVSSRPALLYSSLLTPLVLLPLSLPGYGRSASYEEFLGLYMARFNAPIWLAWWGLVVLYAYAWLRGIRASINLLVALLLVGAFLPPRMRTFEEVAFPSVGPIAAVAAFCLLRLWRKPTSSLRWFFFGGTTLATLTIALWNTPFLWYSGAAPVHLAMLLLLLIGLLCRDEFALAFRIAGTSFLLWLSGAGLLAGFIDIGPPPWASTIQLPVLTLLAWLACYLNRTVEQRRAAVVVTFALILHLFPYLIRSTKRLPNSQATALLVAGIASFITAAAISAQKALRNRRNYGNGDTPDRIAP